MVLSKRQQLLINISAVAVFIFIILRWFFLIDKYSVNMLFWDQWDFMGGLFEDKGAWELFSWQHGPHRQGVGFFLTKLVADLSGWNTRVECFMIGTVICLAASTALALKWRLAGNISAFDIAIPLLYLSPLQFELFANTPNVSHGAMPLLLITLFCLCWTIQNIVLRYALCAAINFMTIYTGFGVFLGCITPSLFLSEIILAFRTGDQKRKTASVLFFFVSIASMLSFFINYTFNSAAEGFVFPHPEPFIYIKFISVAFATYFGFRMSYEISYFIGIIIAIFTIYIIVLSGRDICRNILKRTEVNDADQIIALLAIFSTIFVVNLAIGRACLGIGAATASRYTPYMTPAFFSMYLFAVTKDTISAKQIAVCAACFSITTFSIGNHNKIYAKQLVSRKERWRSEYLATEDIFLADKLSVFKIYPDPHRANLKGKLDYLKKRGLNLYLEHPVQR